MVSDMLEESSALKANGSIIYFLLLHILIFLLFWSFTVLLFLDPLLLAAPFKLYVLALHDFL